jgi:hypothetical protein
MKRPFYFNPFRLDEDSLEELATLKRCGIQPDKEINQAYTFNNLFHEEDSPNKIAPFSSDQAI